MKYEHTKTIAELEEMGFFAITPKRLAAAKRALQRISDKDPLFAASITDDAALQRVLYYAENFKAKKQADRKHIAQQWLTLRKILRIVPPGVRTDFFDRWNRPNWNVPRKPEYGLDILRELLCRHYGFNGNYRYSNIVFG